MMKTRPLFAALSAALGLSLLGVAFAQSGTPTPPAPAASAAGPAAGKPHAHRMGRLDANGDRTISREEAKGHPGLEKNFEAMDANKDGKLSPDEMKAFRDKQRAEHGKGDHPHGHGDHGPGMGHPHPGKGEPPHGKGEHKPKIDTNGDGLISRDEAKGHPMLEKHFDQIDANKDGQLSKEEMQAARQKHREQMKPEVKPAAK